MKLGWERLSAALIIAVMIVFGLAHLTSALGIRLGEQEVNRNSGSATVITDTQTEQTQRPSGVKVDRDLIKNQVDTIFNQIKQIRQLTASETPEITFYSRTEILEYLTSRLNFNTERLAYEKVVLENLNLISPDVELEKLYRESLEYNILGFYDSLAEKLVVLETPASNQNEVIAHELVHYLQNENYTLEYSDSNADEQLALISLMEGDATYHMRLFLEETSPDRRFINVDTGISGVDYFDYQFSFPYIYGLQFIEQAIEHGGVEYLDTIYSNPPTSTEQILDFSKYLSGHHPSTVNYTVTDDILYEVVAGAAYWRKIFDINSAPDYCADNWGGDRITLSRSGDSREVLTVAYEFDDALSQRRQRVCMETLANSTDASLTLTDYGEFILKKQV
jgi:hypothetical protein